MKPKSQSRYHDEVVEALSAIGNPDLGEGIRKDRGSELEHLGIRSPDLRKRVRQGISFSDLPEDEVLEVWDGLWRSSPYGDVLFAALEYYAPIVRKRVSRDLWPVVRQWTGRVDNWCHSDLLSGLYSRILERYPDDVYPQMQVWNAAESEWLRRISVVSLVHYSGRNAVFLPPDRVLPLVSNCLGDARHDVQTAVGWVLREMANVYPDELGDFLERHASEMSASAFSRAIERQSPDDRARLQERGRSLGEAWFGWFTSVTIGRSKRWKYARGREHSREPARVRTADDSAIRSRRRHNASREIRLHPPLRNDARRAGRHVPQAQSPPRARGDALVSRPLAGGESLAGCAGQPLRSSPG